MKYEEILCVIPKKFRGRMEKRKQDMDKLQEIRFRIGQPVELLGMYRKFLGEDRVERADIKEMLEYISGYSLYAFEEEISQGFITIAGGHRVGVAGRVVMDGKRVKNIRNISFLNIRLSHEVIGCGEKLLPFIIENNQVKNTLLVSPPRCGKTTILRDLVRLISGEIENECGKNTVVIDERSEIGGCCQGVPQNDLGCRTDVLDGCPKSEGMLMAVRSLSPEVMVVDEIGGREDVQALKYVMNCGCSLIATVHGKHYEEILQKPELGELLRQGAFQRIIVLCYLSGPGHVQEICNGRGGRLL